MENAQNSSPVPKMSRRSIRESVFKLLFLSEFNSENEMADQRALFFEGVGSDVCERLQDQLPDAADQSEIDTKYANVQSRLDEIDRMLNETSEGWKTSRMGKVDLSVLRLAVYELLYDPDVPTGVAINEAVEMAKKYGGEDSRGFVNGILGKIAKEKRS